MKPGPSLLGLRTYARRRLRLRGYLDEPGDGRILPQIPAVALLWALIASRILREHAFSATEHLVHNGRRGVGVDRPFGDDALGYFTERLDAERLRGALRTLMQRAKRNKVFDEAPRIGLAIDGTGLGRSTRCRCELCHPIKDAKDEVVGYNHKMAGATVVAEDLALPLDVEFYRSGEGEVTAAKRLLERIVRSTAIRFDYVVVDGLYPGAPFLHLTEQLRIPVVARLKENLPELLDLARRRYQGKPPTFRTLEKGERIEIWDADDFEPWDGLRWSDVRVIRYRQHRKNGEVCEAYWLTNFPSSRLSSLALYHICKSRWQIENRFFNEAKNQYGLEHVPHHQANAVLIHALLTCLALCLERLYRLRYLHRGGRPPYTAVDLCRLLWLSLREPPPHDSG